MIIFADQDTLTQSRFPPNFLTAALSCTFHARDAIKDPEND